MCCCSYLERSPVEFALKADANVAESWVYTVPVINPALNPAVRANGSFTPNVGRSVNKEGCPKADMEWAAFA